MEFVINYHMIEKHRREDLIFRIMENSELRPNGCREWIATRNKGGYGLIHFAINRGDGYKSSLPAHRAYYMAHHNVILERNQFVCHKCDNPCCVNIEHLLLGSPKANTKDMIAKGRKTKKHKLHTRQRVYSDDVIRSIKSFSGSLREVSEAYGVSMSYVSRLRNGKAKTLV